MRETMIGASLPLRPERVYEALSDTHARRVVAACVGSAKPVKQISEEARLPLATAYRQVGRLVERGVLVVERRAFTSDGRICDLYRSRIRSARIELDADGERLAWEPNEDFVGRPADWALVA